MAELKLMGGYPEKPMRFWCRHIRSTSNLCENPECKEHPRYEHMTPWERNKGPDGKANVACRVPGCPCSGYVHAELEFDPECEYCVKAAMKGQPKLDPEAKQALGRISPELAQLQLVGLVFQWVDAHEEEAELLRREMDLEGDFEELDVALQLINPVVLINRLHCAAPNLNLRDLNHQDPVEATKAVILMFTIIDRMNRL